MLDWRKSAFHYLLHLAVLTVVYFGAAKLGLTMSFVHGTISPVWPPTGLAVGALALWGPRRLWPAIAAGAFWANFDAGHTIAVAAAIAVGNTLEAVLGSSVLRRLGTVGEPAGAVDALAMLGVAVVAPLPSATAGVLSLSLGGLADWNQFPQEWLVWWVGDALGALVVMPVLLAWLGRPVAGAPIHQGELVACLIVVIVASLVVFAGDAVWAHLGFGRILFTPLLVPPLVWAALRLRPRGATLALAVMAALAVWATVNGHGPFAYDEPIVNLVRLQLMLASLGATLLVLAGAITELKAASQRAEEAKRRADEASAAKSRFVAAVRHDLSQPLQAAQLFLAALAGRPLDGEDRDLAKYLAGSLEAMNATLEALNDITAVECDLVHPDVSVFVLGEVLDQLAEEYRVQALRKGLDFRYVSCSRAVRTDRQLLGRVLRNLLANAVRYTAEGRVLLGCRRDPSGLRIEVWDTGLGVPSEEQEAIFVAFHRVVAPAQPAEPNGSLGLGLATVSRLAALLGFTVAVRSTLGKGSAFSVVVPTPGSHAGNWQRHDEPAGRLGALEGT
jgi:signal transduction histidine kinase